MNGFMSILLRGTTVFCGDTLVGAVTIVEQDEHYRPDFAKVAAPGRDVDQVAKQRRATERSSGTASPHAKEPDLGSLIRRTR